MTDGQDTGGREQRRRFSRRQVELRARLLVGGKDLDAVIENISPGGAFLRVELPEDAREVLAWFDLPHGRELPVRAKVRWRRSMPPGVGVEFVTFLPEPPPAA